MDELKKYCLQDVKLTRDLYEFAKKEKKLYFLSPLGQKKEVVFFARDPISRGVSGTFDFQSALFWFAPTHQALFKKFSLQIYENWK